MLVIEHRCNSIDQLIALPKINGCEIDIRNHGRNLIVAHDPFDETGPIFSDWLRFFNHEFLVLNVKEEGLEEVILQELQVCGVNNFFILDESLPYIRKWALAGLKNFALRVSEFEHYDNALLMAQHLVKFNKMVSWIWVDTFTGQILSRAGYDKLKDAGFKLCFVSPELHYLNSPQEWLSKVRSYQILMSDVQIVPDAICTKLPDLWRNNKSYI